MLQGISDHHDTTRNNDKNLSNKIVIIDLISVVRTLT